MSADSAMKCTPQKTMYRRVRPGGGLLGELEAVAGHVGELDDLVALVVVAEHEHGVAERGLGRAGAGHQVRGRTGRAGRRGTRRRARCPGPALPEQRAAAQRRWAAARCTSSCCVMVPSGARDVAAMVSQLTRRSRRALRLDGLAQPGARALRHRCGLRSGRAGRTGGPAHDGCSSRPDPFAGTLTAARRRWRWPTGGPRRLPDDDLGAAAAVGRRARFPRRASAGRCGGQPLAATVTGPDGSRRYRPGCSWSTRTGPGPPTSSPRRPAGRTWSPTTTATRRDDLAFGVRRAARSPPWPPEPGASSSASAAPVHDAGARACSRPSAPGEPRRPRRRRRWRSPAVTDRRPRRPDLGRRSGSGPSSWPRDVDVPLLGSRARAPWIRAAEGRHQEQAQALEAAFGHWATSSRGCCRSRATCSAAARSADREPGAGAAGGIGYALLLLGARRVPAHRCVAEPSGCADAARRRRPRRHRGGDLRLAVLRGKVVAGGVRAGPGRRHPGRGPGRTGRASAAGRP